MAGGGAAGVAAAAAKHLARPDARVWAVLGSGVRARSHSEALVRVRAFEELRVWGRDASRVRALLEEVAPRVLQKPALMIAAASAAAAADGADVIVLVTASREPVLTRAAVRDGAHVCALGACRPDQREIDTALVRDARVFVDSRAGALAEAGDLVIPIREGAIEPSPLARAPADASAG